MFGLLAALDEVQRVADHRRTVEQFIEDRHQPRMKVAVADHIAFEKQVVEFHRTLEGLVRRIGEPHAAVRGAGEQVDDHAAGHLVRASVAMAQPLDQRIDRIDDVRAEELRQDQIAVAVPLLFCSERERRRAGVRRVAAGWRSRHLLHPGLLLGGERLRPAAMVEASCVRAPRAFSHVQSITCRHERLRIRSRRQTAVGEPWSFRPRYSCSISCRSSSSATSHCPSRIWCCSSSACSSMRGEKGFTCC